MVFHGQRIDRREVTMKKKYIFIIPIVIALLAFVFVYRYYNKEDKTTTGTRIHKNGHELFTCLGTIMMVLMIQMASGLP